MRHAFGAFGSTPAESLIETIISVTVIVIATTASLSMLRSSLEGNEIVGQKEIAINLTLEGLDALKNIRDTNYLRFADSASDCWNAHGVMDAADCGSNQLAEGSTYYFTRYFTGDLSWNVLVERRAADASLSLYTLDLGSGNTMEIYAQKGLAPADGFTLKTSGVFSRSMTLIYNADSTAYDATVTVSWLDGDLTHQVSLTRTIANVY